MDIPTRLLDTVEELPPLPLTVRRLVELLADEDFLIAELLRVVEEDPVLVGRLIRAANSAVYGWAQETQSTRAAVVRLGLHRVTEVGLAGTLFDLGSANSHSTEFQDDFWLHSQAAARASEKLSKAMGARGPSKLVGAAALMHDVGQLVIFHSGLVSKREMDEAVKSHRGDLLKAERALVGCDHTDVGVAVAEKWGLPAPMVRAIAEHHTVPENDDAIVDTVILADAVALAAGAGLGESPDPPHVPETILERRGLTEESFMAICLEVEAMVDVLRESHMTTA